MDQGEKANFDIMEVPAILLTLFFLIQLPNMLISRQGPACIATEDGRIMVTGGVTEFTVEFYDPLTDNWSLGGDLPKDRDGHQLVRHDGEVYLVGGYSFYDLHYPEYITSYNAELDQ